MKKVASIVIVCTVLLSIGVTSVFATGLGDSMSSISNSFYTANNQVYISTVVNYSDPYYIQNFIDAEYYYNTNGNTLQQPKGYKQIACQDFNIAFQFYNYSDDVYVSDLAYLEQRINGSFANTSSYLKHSMTVSDTAHEIRLWFNDVNGGTNIRITPDITYHGTGVNGIVLPPHSVKVINFSMQIYSYNSDSSQYDTSAFKYNITNFTNVAMGSWTVNNDVVPYDTNSNLVDINNNVQSILNAYTSQTANVDALNNKTDNLDGQVSTIHNQEQQWYQQNTQAIEATGLSNFEFSSDNQAGISTINTLFNQLWNSLGNWTFVYTFTLLISLTMYILRHRTYKASKGEKAPPGFIKGAKT